MNEREMKPKEERKKARKVLKITNEWEINSKENEWKIKY